tara:strand:+ start:2343 stop:4268 length:1926 start_codon:yes stop_codon:yes gene_type:complete
MAQNRQMGAGMMPPPASPANPTAVNFQSDPNMRQQFKGFMSGLSNRMTQQSAPPPAPLPMPMPINMQNVDIFQPVRGFANGGGVTFSSGSDYTPGGGISISSATVQGDDTFQGENQQTLDDIQAMSNPINFSPSEATAFAAPTPFAQMVANVPFESGVLGTPEFGIPDGDALSSALTQAQIDRYNSMPTISQQAGQAQVQLGRDMRMPDGSIFTTDPVAGPQARTELSSPIAKSGFSDDLKAARTNLLLDADAVANLAAQDANLLMTDFGGPEERSREAMDAEAQRLSMGGGQVNVDPVTGALSSIPVPIAMPDAVREQRERQQASSDVQAMQNPFNRGEAAGERVAQGQPSAIAVEEANPPEFGLPDTVFDAGAFTPTEVQAAIDAARTKGGDTTTVEAGRGLGARQVFDTLGAKAPEDQSFLGALYDTITGRQYPTEEEINQGVIDAQNRRTTATLGFQDPRFGGVAPPVNTPGAVTRSALSQLESRANRQGSGILGAFTNFGARNARNMFDDIVTKGYEPVYDSRGQIVATRVPGTNILGRGSVESRIPGMAGSSDGGGPQLPPVVAQTAEEDAGEETPPIIKLPPIAGPPGIDLPILPEPVKPAEVGNPLGFGYGQYTPANSNLESSVDKFIKMLGG